MSGKPIITLDQIPSLAERAFGISFVVIPGLVLVEELNATKYGFYSQEAAEAECGTSFYATPDGREVEVSCVSSNPQAPEYLWADKIYLGVVTKWLRTGQKCRDEVFYEGYPDLY